MNLVGVGKTTHTTHDAEHIVVGGEHLDGIGRSETTVEFKGGGVNARHVAGARWLVLLGLEGEGVHIDGVGGGHTLVMLVGLDELEVHGLTHGHTLVAVEGDLSLGVTAGVGTVSSDLNPHNLLHGMVEVHLDVLGGSLVTSELELLDEVLVRVLRHTTALISVKEHVVNVE